MVSNFYHCENDQTSLNYLNQPTTIIMKNTYLTLLLCFGLTAVAFSQEESSTCKDLSQIVEMERQANAQLLDFRSPETTGNYDLKYHRMEWSLDPNVNYIDGQVTSYFEPTTDDFQQINFDLAMALTVTEVLYQEQSLTFNHTAANILEINLPQVIPQGQLDSVTVVYQGAPVYTGFGSFRKGITHDGNPIIWTLSEPYGAKDWWPCKLDLSDKVDSIDVIVNTPLPYRVATNGLLVSETQEGNNMIYHWKHRYPITAYLIAVAVADFEVYSNFVPVENGPDIEVLNYVYPEKLEQAMEATPATVEIMQLFNELFGLYPFADEKYGHAQFGFGGGMEHQTMSFMGGWSHSLQAHELAHQWFGDKVTCGSWQDIWLNEGFATYLDGLTYENGLGNTNWHDWLEGRIERVTEQPGGSVFVQDTTNLGQIFSGRLSYSKGAMLLHMLRWKLGDEDFFQACRNYLNDPELAYGYARTADLKAHLEAQSGLDLTGFFNDWFYNQGYPSYQVNWWQDGEVVKVNIQQTTSHASVDFFEMPVPLLFSGEGQDSLVVFDHTYSGQQFSINLPFAPEAAVFDPDLWIVSKGNVVNNLAVATEDLTILAQLLKVAPNPAGDFVTVTFQDWPKLPNNLRVFSSTGQLLVEISQPHFRNVIDVSSFSPGVYLISIQSDRGKVRTRFIKK